RRGRLRRLGLSSWLCGEDDLGAGTAAGPCAEREAPAKALFDHPLDELKTETCCALDTVSAVVDEEAMVFSRVQLNADWRDTVLKRVRDQLVGDDPDFLGCGCVEGGGLGLDSNWYRCSVRDAGEQGSCLDGIVGLCEQPVDDGDRLDAGGGVVEGATITVLGTAEQE